MRPSFALTSATVAVLAAATAAHAAAIHSHARTVSVNYTGAVEVDTPGVGVGAIPLCRAESACLTIKVRFGERSARLTATDRTGRPVGMYVAPDGVLREARSICGTGRLTFPVGTRTINEDMAADVPCGVPTTGKVAVTLFR